MKKFNKVLNCLIFLAMVFSCKPNIPLLAPGLVDNQLFNKSKATITWDVPAGASAFEYRLNEEEWIRVGLDVTEVTLELKDGEYIFSIRSIDANGHPSEDVRSVKFTVNTASVATPVPITIGLRPIAFFFDEDEAESDGYEVTSNSRPKIVWEAVEGAVEYRVSINDGEWVILSSPNKLSFTPGKDLEAGDYVFKVAALSISGKWSEPGIVKIRIVKETNIPVFLDTTPSITNNLRPTWMWKVASDEYNPVIAYRYQLNHEFAGGWQEEDVDDIDEEIEGSYTPEEELFEGVYVLHVQILDFLGNWSKSSSFAIRIDKTAPEKPRLRGIARTNNTSPVWTWSYIDADDVAKLGYKINTSEWKELEDLEINSYQLEDYLGDGDYELFLRVADEAGNWTEEVSYKIFIDTSLTDLPVLSTEAAFVDGAYVTDKRKPNWTWTVPEGAYGFRYQLCAGEDEEDDENWTEVNMGITGYQAEEDLDLGSYTLYVQAKNDLGSWSSSAGLTININA